MHSDWVILLGGDIMQIFDTHCDTLCALSRYGAQFFSSKTQFSTELLGDNTYTQFFACFIGEKYYIAPKTRCISLINTFDRMVYNNHNIKKCVKYEDICNRSGFINAFLSIEGGECIKSVSDVEYYYRRGVRLIAPVWNNRNRLASGVDANGGVTEFGARVIERMNLLGILLDVSHMNERSFYDATAKTSLPPIASHSCAYSVCPHKRNLTDAQFCLIRDRGGFVGVNFYPQFLCGTGRAKISDILDHIEHFLMLGGEDTVGLGSDFDGIDETPAGLSDIGQIDALISEMRTRGWSECLVRKILFENACNITRFL